MKPFIYVFNEEAKKKLLCGGMCLVGQDEGAGIYVFARGESECFALNDVSYIESDMLTL